MVSMSELGIYILSEHLVHTRKKGFWVWTSQDIVFLWQKNNKFSVDNASLRVPSTV